MLSRAAVYSDHKWLALADDTIGQYNALDCIATARVHRALMQEQVENGQYDHFRNVYWPMIEHIVELQRRGLRLDRNRLHDYGLVVRAEIERCEGEIAAATGVAGTNLNSTRQVASLLFGTLGLKSFKLTDSGADSTDQEALDRCLRNLRKKDEAARPVLEALFHRSRYSTIEKRYLKLYPDDDGRVRPTIKAGKVETLRLAYADPALQQMPKETRHIFVPKSGHVFVEADFSQLEARILAVLSGDRRDLDAFARGEDVHAIGAQDLLGLTPEQWAQRDEEFISMARSLSKAFRYGITYGGKAETLKARLFCPCPKCKVNMPNTLALSRTDMKAAEERWFSKHGAVREFRATLDTIARSQGIKRSYTTPFGYKRIFFNPYPEVMTEIYNFPFQAGAAGLVNERFIRAMRAGLPIVLQMHDSFVMECPRSEAMSHARQLKEIMEAPTEQMGGTVFPTDCKIGESWGEMEKVRL